MTQPAYAVCHTSFASLRRCGAFNGNENISTLRLRLFSFHFTIPVSKYALFPTLYKYSIVSTSITSKELNKS